MEEKQNLSGEALEEALRGHRSKAALARVVTYGAGAVMVVCLIAGSLPLMLVFLVIAMISGYQLSRHTKAIKETLSSNIVSGVLEEIFDSVEYQPFGYLPEKLVNEAGMIFPFSQERVRGSDHIKAVYRGLQVELSDIELYHIEDYYDDERGVWEERENKVFQGQWLVCDFGKAFSGEVHLSSGGKKLRKLHRKDSVEMENTAFNDRFLVAAEDPQEAYYILTPHMMEYILRMAEQCGGDVYMSFLRGGKLHIAVQTGRDFFELGKNKADINQLRQKFLGELRWFTDIIDTLRVEDTLYRKETDR